MSNAFKFVKEIDEIQGVNQGTTSEQLLAECEQVIIKSLIKSFGLDIFIKDKRGGDVDTINTVRDPSVVYSSEDKKNNYDSKEPYKDKKGAYHGYSEYKNINKELCNKKINGDLEDAYTGISFKTDDRTNLDHVISAKEIHEDPGRVLAGIDGIEIANRPSNLKMTNPSVNSSKGQHSVNDFLQRLDRDAIKRENRKNKLQSKEILSEEEHKELLKLERLNSIDREKIQEIDKNARKCYNYELATTYYFSEDFWSHTTKASLKKGLAMGIRQSLGLLLVEFWFALKKELPIILEKIKNNFELKIFLEEIVQALKRVFKKVCSRFKEFIIQFRDGVLSGILSSLMSTMINIFITTSKYAGKIIREIWTAVVEVVKILILNPKKSEFEEKLREVLKVIAITISVVCGSLVGQYTVNLNPLKFTPINKVLPTFLECMTTGIMTIFTIYFIETSEAVNKLIKFANGLIQDFDNNIKEYEDLNRKLVQYASDLSKIDYNTLDKNINTLNKLNIQIKNATTSEELNSVLHNEIKICDIVLPYDNLDIFMGDPNNILEI